MVRSVTPAGRLSGPGLWPRTAWLGLLGAALWSPVVVAGAWFALHHIPGAAPWAADTLRSVIGVDGVARLEGFAYGVEDRVLTVWRRGERPKAHWAVPPPALPAPTVPVVALIQTPAPGPALDANALAARLPEVGLPEAAFVAPASLGRRRGDHDEPEPVSVTPFRPRNVGPMLESWSAPGDGEWVVLPDSTPLDSARMFKTLLHPDPDRSWAELFVVALDLRRVRLYTVPGTVEPQATLPEALEMPRPGRVPDEHHQAVLAAFNGGFKTEHGHYGMYVNGVTIVPPNEASCTIAYFKDFSLRIGSWPKVRDQLDEITWWRQTPTCMFEDGKMHPRMAEGFVTRWGSTVDGETVIRRSAIGIDADGKTLFVGISNHTTAPAIANGMRHAGAVTVAQLDINFSFPKFVTFRPSRISKLRVAVPLTDDFEYSEHEYLRKASNRDFFYVLDASLDGRTASN